MPRMVTIFIYIMAFDYLPLPRYRAVEESPDDEEHFRGEAFYRTPYALPYSRQIMSQFFFSTVDDELVKPIPSGVVVAVRVYSPTGGHWELVQVSGNLLENMPAGSRSPPDWGSPVGWHFVRYLDSEGEFRESARVKALMYFSPRRYLNFWVPVELHPGREVPPLFKFDGRYLDLTNAYQTSLRPELAGENLLERVLTKLAKPDEMSWDEWSASIDWEEWNNTTLLHHDYSTTYRSICEKVLAIRSGRAYTVNPP